ncbi:MAG: DDE-type integrase/transposase/recombinase [Sulfurospirillum sp.]|nr:DDE-type integrase/transposase/recombinase [Sulfurospirillum sp.]
MNKISLKIGSIVYFENKAYKITKPISTKEVLGKELDPPYELKVLKVIYLKAQQEERKKEIDISIVDDKSWTIANERFKIIEPFVGDSLNTTEDVKKRAEEFNVSMPTLYRWISIYKSSGTISSLIPNYKRRGGVNKGRLGEEEESIISKVTEEKYLNPQKYSLKVIYRDIVEKFSQAGLPIPHINTIRNRVKKIDPKLITKKRELKKVSDTRGLPDKNPYGTFPLQQVQIDHTKLDIMLVDDNERKSIGRPYITVAIDVFSRMIAGFYLSFEPPGFFNTGQCILNMILPKDDFLLKVSVDGEWPIYGIPNMIATDNAKEFRSIDLKKFCDQYSIELVWRPVGRSYYGGHVERVIKTISKEVHTLPGTTFSNINERGNYDSEANATMTISELEQWLTEYIVNVYNKTVHSGIGMTPEEKYYEGIFGLGSKPGTGLPAIIENSKLLKLSLLPSYERTVQKNGITIDHVTYFSDVLRKWIVPQEASKKGASRLFICKRDPRDISKIYFYDPDLRQYFDVPYRNITNPKIDLSELRDTISKIKEEKGPGRFSIDTNVVFNAYKKMKNTEEKAVIASKKIRRKKSSKKHLGKKLEEEKKIDIKQKEIQQEYIQESSEEETNQVSPELFGFEVFDDGE